MIDRIFNHPLAQLGFSIGIMFLFAGLGALFQIAAQMGC